MLRAETQNSEEEALEAGNERRFHEVKLAFLGCRFFGLVRKDFFEQQDEQAQDPQHQHRAGHADQRQRPAERPAIHWLVLLKK